MQKAKDRSPLNNAGQHISSSAPRENTAEGKRNNMLEYQQRIEDLLNEIQQKEMTISALQRNYEGISLIYKEEKKKSLEWSGKIADIDKDNGVLKMKIQTVEAQKQKVLRDLEKAQEELNKFYRSVEDHRACKFENQGLKSTLEKKKKELEELARKVEISKGEADALKKAKVDLGATLKKVQSENEQLLKERPELIDEIDRQRYEYDVLLIASNKKQEELERCNKELNIVRAREHKYFTELATIKQSFEVEKDELYATRAKLVELYDHYKILESQIETKTALLHLAQSTEHDLTLKVNKLDAALKEKQEDISQWTNNKDYAMQMLDQANKEIEKLLIDNEDLRDNEELFKRKIASFLYLTNELEKVIKWYNSEGSKIGRQADKLEIPQEASEKKAEKLVEIITSVFNESILLIKHYEELNVKYNLIVVELQNTRAKDSPGPEADSNAKLLKSYEKQIETLSSSLKQLESELEANKLELQRRDIELDTSRQRISMLEKDIKLKSAVIFKYEEKINGDPDELLSRIEQLKKELEEFNVNTKDNSRGNEKEAKNAVERLKHALSSINANLTCKSCLNVLSEAVIYEPCGHIVCTECKDLDVCKECGRNVLDKLRVAFIDEFASKIIYVTQATEDIKILLNV